MSRCLGRRGCWKKRLKLWKAEKLKEEVTGVTLLTVLTVFLTGGKWYGG